MKKKSTLLLLAMATMFMTPLLAATAQNKKKLPAKNNQATPEKKVGKKLLIEADRINEDKKTNIIRAEGNVKVHYNDQLLKSDKLIFDKPNNKLVARGNVYFKDDNGAAPGNRIIVSQEMEMVGDFKSGVSQALVGRIGEHGSITASESHWEKGSRVFKDVSYTNCYLCSPFGDNVPLWRVRASTAVEDKETSTLKLYNTWVEAFNVPILYSPYLSFPNRRGSGLLLPVVRYNITSGLIIRPSIFVVISDYSDLLFNPYFTINQGMIGSLMFRQRFAYTDLNIGGIALYDNPAPGIEKKWQGYGYFDFLTSLNSEWKISGAGRWATPQNFFQHYTFLTQPASPGNDLISYIAATGYISPHYVNYSYYYYQDNRAGNPFDKILVGPRVEFFGRGNRTSSGGQWRVDGDMRYYIEPNQGTNGLVRLDAGWQQPVYFFNGMVFNINAGIRFDYIASHFYKNYNVIPGISIPGRDTTLSSLGDNNHKTIRAVPEILATLSYPLVGQSKKNSLIIEPIVGAYFSFGGLLNKKANGGNNGGNPNNIIFDTDSSPLEINSDNLFLLNRTLGSSYYEDYGRLAYGLKLDNIFKDGGGYKLFIGHGINFFGDQNPYVPKDLRYNKSSTDIIINASWMANKFLTVSNSMLLNDRDFSINRHVARADVNYQNITLGLSYFYYKNDSQLAEGKLRQIVPVVIVKIGDNWQLRWETTGDILTPDFRIKSMAMGITYTDECWYMALTAKRVFPAINVTDTGGWQFGFDWRIVAF